MTHLYRFVLLWIICALVLGGKNWKFPYGVKAAVRAEMSGG